MTTTSPAAHKPTCLFFSRRPRPDYESHATALARTELSALLTAGLGPPAGHALISLLALNGPRTSEAAGAGIDHPGPERGHRTLVITRKGGKVVTIPLAPRTARAIDLAAGERTQGPLLPAAGGRRPGRHGAARVTRRVTRRAQIARHFGNAGRDVLVACGLSGRAGAGPVSGAYRRTRLAGR